MNTAHVSMRRLRAACDAAEAAGCEDVVVKVDDLCCAIGRLARLSLDVRLEEDPEMWAEPVRLFDDG